MKHQHSAADLSRAAESIVIALAQQGSADAFGEIVKRRHSQVRRFMCYLSGNTDQGDDLAQQVFLKAWRSIRQLDAPAAFGAWLKQVMVTTWLEQVRRKQVSLVRDFDLENLASRRSETSQNIDLESALAQLSPNMRLCVVLAYHEGMTHDEVAAVTKLPLGTVKSNIARGSARLKEILSCYGAGG